MSRGKDSMFSPVTYEHDEKDREIAQCAFYTKSIWVIAHTTLCNAVMLGHSIQHHVHYIILTTRARFKNSFFLLRKCNLFSFDNIL